MRPTALAVRSLTALVLALAAVGCDELPTQTGRLEPRRLQTSTAGSPSLRLLACPTEEEARSHAVIGPDGGTLGARGTSITIPAGAVPVPTQFEVVVPVSPYMEVEIHAVGRGSYTFAQPASITINYARCPDDAVPADAALEGVYVESGTRRVLERMGGTSDKNGHKVTFATPHLSGYIVAY